MKELILGFLVVGILKGIETIIAYNLETGNQKVVSILEYRNRAALMRLCED